MGTDAPSEPTGGSRERRHVLVLDGADTAPFAGPCLDHLVADGPEATDVVLVTVTQSSRDRLEALGDRLDRRPAKLGVVAVDEQTRGGGGSAPGQPDRLSITSVGTAGDLTGLGIAITEYLSAWAGDGNRTVVCIHSLTALLQSVPVDQAFEFLNALLSRTGAANATVHVHMNPDAHDDQTFQAVSTLFDEVADARDNDRRGAVEAGAAVAEDHHAQAAGGSAPSPAGGGDDPPDPTSASGGEPDDRESTTDRLAVLAAVGLVAMVALAGISYAGTGQFLSPGPDAGAAALDDATPTQSPDSTAGDRGTTAPATETSSPRTEDPRSPTPSAASTPTPTPTVPPTPTTPDPEPTTPVETPTVPPTPTVLPDTTQTPTPDDGLLDGGDDGLVGNLTDDDDDDGLL